MADPVNHTIHLTNHDMDLDKVRICFKGLETYMILDNYFRSISGLPPAPYPECQPSQMALEQNSPYYLTLLVNLEVNSILRTLEIPDIYIDRNAVLSQLIPQTSLTNGSEKGTSTEKENNSSPGFRPITCPASENNVQESPQVTHSSHGTIGNTNYPRMDNSLNDPCECCGSSPSSEQGKHIDNTLCSAVGHAC